MSEFEQMNEEAFGMIRQNRDCHPGGVPVRLVTDSKWSDLVNALENEKRKFRDADSQRKKAEFDLRMMKTVRAVYLIGSAGFAALAFLLGLAL